MGIYQNAKEAARTAIEALGVDELEINRENLFDWLADHPPADDSYDDLDDWLESFEEHALAEDDESEDDEE